MYAYGGVFENLSRAFKVMHSDFKDAVRNPNRIKTRTRLG